MSVLASRWKMEPESHLFILRYRNWPEYVLCNENTRERLTEITLNRNAPSEVATVFNADRCDELEGELKVRIVDFLPTLIVYDFFCLEARLVARDLGIPAVCSIPATLKPDETETCSDGVLPREHMYWIWRTWYEVSISPVRFMGPRPYGDQVREWDNHEFVFNRRHRRNCQWILISLGTVIPESDSHMQRVKLLLSDLALVVAEMRETTNFMFVGMSKFKDLVEASDAVYFEEGDLRDFMIIMRPVLLIFHGGGNTFAEAIQAHVPVLVCPFFGDQFETARQAGSDYVAGDGDMLTHIERAIQRGPLPVLNSRFEITDTFSDHFKNGDLVFGHRRHRDALQFNFPQCNLHLNHYAPFNSFADASTGLLPAIADVYNDDKDKEQLDTEYGRRLAMIRYVRSTTRAYLHLPEEHRLVHYCLDIMMITVNMWKNKIHFVLGADMSEIGPATTIELEFVKSNWSKLRDALIFYNTSGQRVPAPFFRHVKDRSIVSVVPPQQISQSDRYFKLLPSMIPFISGRIKSAESIKEKSMVRRIPSYDMIAYRTGYLNAQTLEEMVAKCVSPDYTVRVRTCDCRVHYYNWHNNRVEVQLWPWAYLHYFYQNMAGIESSREEQRITQDKIEGEGYDYCIGH